MVDIIAPVQAVVLFFLISVSGINEFGNTGKRICDVISGGRQIHVTVLVNVRTGKNKTLCYTVCIMDLGTNNLIFGFDFRLNANFIITSEVLKNTITVSDF